MSDERSHPSLLSREALYEAVWTTSMVQLSRQFGLSDQGLRKICTKQQIPVPKAGYWAKVAVGKAVDRPPLKPFSQSFAEQAARVRRSSREAEKTGRSAAWSPPPGANVVAPVRWHPSLGPLRKELAEAATKARHLKRVSEWEEKHPRSRHPDRDRLNLFGSWTHFCSRGQILRESHGKSVFRVSLAHYERALRCLNSIIVRANERGFTVSMQGRNERLVFKRAGSAVTMRITEKLAEQHRKEYRAYKQAWENVKTHESTGRLTIYLESTGGGEKSIADQPNDYLEQHLDDIVAALDVRHAASVKRDEENRLWRVRYEEEQRMRAERQRNEEEARKRAAEERARREALIAEAGAWRTAMEVRDYLSELDRRFAKGGVAAADFTEWRAWAELVANALDSSGSRVRISEPLMAQRDPGETGADPDRPSQKTDYSTHTT